MTLLILYPIKNTIKWDPENFKELSDENAFKVIWANKDQMGATFYNMDSKEDDEFLYLNGILNAKNFKEDYNEGVHDKGCWTECLHLKEEFIKQTIKN